MILIVGLVLIMLVMFLSMRDAYRRETLTVYINDHMNYFIASIREIERLHARYCPDAEDAAAKLDLAKHSYRGLGERIKAVPNAPSVRQLAIIKRHLDEGLIFVNMAWAIVDNRMTTEQLATEDLL
jgi:hypothetical protein